MKLLSWFKKNYGLVIVLCIGAALRFYHIDYQSVWLDEIHTLNEANPQLSPSGVYNALLVSEAHPPLYFMLVHYAFILFGYTSFVLKMFSAVVGVAGIFAIYLLGNELFDKKIGLYAAILLCINYFHLSYSQEGRMYALLFLLTIFSFYFLVRFIKKPCVKTALICGIFSALMIYCHFFALFTLVAQWLILLFFIIKPVISRQRFFAYCAIAVITTLILFLPALPLLKKTSGLTSIWIQMPGPDVYLQFFKDFFGRSEMVLLFVLLLIAVFFAQLFKDRSVENRQVDPTNNKLVFSFIILFTWICITLLLPLIRTYTALPMLISRYFINLLPAIILIAAIGLGYIGNRVVRYAIAAAIIIFSLTDILIVKKYYKTVSKTQFREVSNYIIDNHQDQESVVSSLGWFFSYFLTDEKIKRPIIDKPLEIYVDEMIKDSTKIQSFWYADAHNRPLRIPAATQKFLDDHFVIDRNADQYDAWTNHYSTTAVPLQEEDISRFIPGNKNEAAFKYYIDVFTIDSFTLTITGFAYFHGRDASHSSIKVLLMGNGKAFKIASKVMRRDDVTINDKSKFDLGNSGFTSKLSLKKLEPGRYQLALIIKDVNTNKEELIVCDKFVER